MEKCLPSVVLSFDLRYILTCIGAFRFVVGTNNNYVMYIQM